MEILRVIKEQAARLGLDFLVVGGHAVCSYGIDRQTGDLDLCVRRPDVGAWRAMLADLGYTPFHEKEGFVQLRPPEIGQWPVDLMIVDEATFQALMGDARAVCFVDTSVPVPSVLHLIAMKLHALRSNLEHRERKDLDDVVSLIEKQELVVDDESFRDLCARFGTEGIYEEICLSLAKRDNRNG